MKKVISLILAAFLALTTASFGACGQSSGSSSVDKPDPVIDGWTTQNILERPVEKDDVRIGTYVAFSDTRKGLSGVDQIERYYYAGLNFMPMICTLPSAGVITEEESSYLTRDLTDSKWWLKIDSLMTEYNMVYFFSTLSGLANDYETSARRESMINDDALADARAIIPQLKRCVGVKIVDEPSIDSLSEYAIWARRYAAITDSDGNSLGLDALVNQGPSYEAVKTWAEKAGASVGLLSYDAYPFRGNGADYAVIALQEQVRKLANEKGMRMAMYPQACSWDGARMPTADEIKWHVNVNLALGVTQFSYFNFMMYPNEGCDDAIFDMDGSVRHPEILEALTELHKEIRTVDAIVRLNSYMVTEAYSTVSGHGLTVLPTTWNISSEGIKDLDLVVTLFEPRENGGKTDKYINIVNGSMTEDVVEREILLGENSEITGLEALNPETGKFEAVDIINGAFRLTLEKSGSLFLRVVGNI